MNKSFKKMAHEAPIKFIYIDIQPFSINWNKN